jgi:GWxTD domain-containing protein
MPLPFKTVTVTFCLIWTFLLSHTGWARLSASLDYYIFPTENGGRVLFLLGVDGASLQYRKVPGGLQGSTAMAMVVNDSTRNFVADRSDYNSPILPDSLSRFQTFSCSRVVALPPGYYQVQIVLFDALSTDTSRERISLDITIPDQEKKGGMSDLLLLEARNLKPGVPILQQDARGFRPSDFFAPTDSILSFYGELYGVHNFFPMGTPFISRVRILDQNTNQSLDEFGRMKRTRAGAFSAIRMDINIGQLPSGNFLLVWDIIDSTGKIISRINRPIKRSNQAVSRNGVPLEIRELEGQFLKMSLEEARHLTASLFPIATRSEQNTLEYISKKGKPDEIARYQQEFWERRDKANPMNPFSIYKERIAAADAKYGTQTMKGYQTERGRVFLQYGPPNIVENEYSDRNRKAMQNLNTIPYEVWYYYSLETPVKQNDVMFVFVQQNRGNYNYRLLHSSGIGEVRNNEWRKWVETNATYNWDRMDPNDRGEIQNPRMAR